MAEAKGTFCSFHCHSHPTFLSCSSREEPILLDAMTTFSTPVDDAKMQETEKTVSIKRIVDVEGRLSHLKT